MRKYLLSIVLLILAVNCFSQHLTREQARAWLSISSEEQILDIIIKYDTLQRSFPNIPMPQYSVFVVGNDLYLTPVYPDGQDYFDIYFGHLHYGMKYEQIEILDVLPDPPDHIWTFILIGAAGITAGFIIGYFIN